jgi:hypothetical protein
VSVGDPDHRPASLALDDEDRPAGLEAARHEAPVRRTERPTLGPEVGHVLDHQPILVGIVHVVELQVRVGIEQHLATIHAPGHVVDGLVRVDAVAAHGYQHCLRQPRDAERRPEVYAGAIRRSNGNGRVGSLGVLSHRPLVGLLDVYLAQPCLGHCLAPAAPDVHLLAQHLWQPVGHRDQRRERVLHAKLGERLALKVARIRAQHR